MQDLTQHPRYEEAVRHARAVRGFWSHALVYVLVNALLLVLAFVAGSKHWAGWTALWWGVGLAAHAWSVFVGNSLMGCDWEREQVRRYLERRG